MLGSLLPVRRWRSLPATFPMEHAAFACGLITVFGGAAVGIPGFLEHAHANASIGLDAALDHMNKTEVYRGDLVIGYTGLSLFTFLLLTPKGWLTMYLVLTGAIRAAAAWFDDPAGDPILTAIDVAIVRARDRGRARLARASREAREGPEIPDRVVSSSAAGIPGSDVVIVASRRKAGWERGVVVLTGDACYRIGEPVEQTVSGRLRTLYPLTEHKDLEAIRKAVHYDLPACPAPAAADITRDPERARSRGDGES